MARPWLLDLLQDGVCRLDNIRLTSEALRNGATTWATATRADVFAVRVGRLLAGRPVNSVISLHEAVRAVSLMPSVQPTSARAIASTRTVGEELCR